MKDKNNKICETLNPGIKVKLKEFYISKVYFPSHIGLCLDCFSFPLQYGPTNFISVSTDSA